MQQEKTDIDIDQEQLIKENTTLRKKLYDLERRADALDASKKKLTIVLEGTKAGYWDWNIKTGELSINAEWASLIGYSLDELEPITINTWLKLCHPDDLLRSRQLLEEHFSGKSTFYEIELRMLHKLGHWVWLLDRGKMFERDNEGNPLRMVGSHEDISLRKNSEEALAHSREFERLITDLSNQFINLPFDHIDGLIDNTLQLIGEFVTADRCYIFQFRDGLRLMDNTHEWCAEGIRPEIGNLKGIETSNIPWWMEQIRDNRIIYLPRVADMEALTEKKILESHDIKSLIVIPLVAGSCPFGYIGFDAVSQEREWPPEIIAVLKLAGGIIASALQRQQVEHFIKAELGLAIQLNGTNSFRETLHYCLQTALLVSGMDCGGVYLVNTAEKTITLTIHEGLSQSFVDQAELYHFDSDNARLILEGQPVYHHFIDSSDLLQRENLRAIAIIPITYRGEVIACLNVASHTLSQITEFARKGLATVTSHLGAAIMQAHNEKVISEGKINLETLFDTIDDFMFIIDMEGIVIHTNATVRTRMGYSCEELHGRHVLQCHPEEQWDTATANIQGMLAGTADVCLVPLKTHSGALIPVETKITRGLWNNKPVLFGISRDISERVSAEQALTESEKRYRELIEMLPLPIFETDTDGTVTYTNSRSIETFGYSTVDLNLGVSAFDFCVPQESAIALAHLAKLKQGYPVSNEFNVRKKDGSTFPALLNSSPIIWNGVVTGTRDIVVDLTELKEKETAERNSAIQERIVMELKALIDNIPGAVYRTSQDGKTTMLSMIKEFQADYTREEFENGVFETGTIIHPEDRDLVSASNRNTAKSNISRSIIFRVFLKNGTIRWLEDRKTLAFSPNGIFTGIDGILFDITERITAQEKKQQLESNIRKTQRLETIGTLAGGIAHDFNNILTPILGYAEMGVMSLSKEEPMQEYFNEIVQAAERARNLVSRHI